MRSPKINTANGLVGASLAMASFFATASTVDVHLTQVPKNPLTNNVTPPSLLPDNQVTYALFRAGLTILGGNEFEGGSGATLGATAGTANFTYSNGASGLATATATGITNSNVVGQTNPVLGRYNMTRNVVTDLNTGLASGHWVEASSTFSYSFSTAISAFSVFLTDLGDLGGTLAIDVYNGATLVKHKEVTNNLGDAQGRANGNLTFYGISSNETTFDKITFTLSGTGPNDVLGIDSIMVGTASASTPEPGSLALVGLALAGLGVARARKRRLA